MYRCNSENTWHLHFSRWVCGNGQVVEVVFIDQRQWVAPVHEAAELGCIESCVRGAAANEVAGIWLGDVGLGQRRENVVANVGKTSISGIFKIEIG